MANLPNGSGIQKFKPGLDKTVWINDFELKYLRGHYYHYLWPDIHNDPHCIKVGTWLTLAGGQQDFFNTLTEAEEFRDQLHTLIDLYWTIEATLDGEPFITINDQTSTYYPERLFEITFIDDPSNPNYGQYCVYFAFRYYLPPQSKGVHIISVTRYSITGDFFSAIGTVTWITPVKV